MIHEWRRVGQLNTMPQLFSFSWSQQSCLAPFAGMTLYAPRPRRYVSPFPLASPRADIRPLQKQVHPDQLTGTKPSRPASPRRKALDLFVFTSEKARYVFKHDGVQYLLEASPYVARLRSKIDRGFETNSMSGR